MRCASCCSAIDGLHGGVDHGLQVGLRGDSLTVSRDSLAVRRGRVGQRRACSRLDRCRNGFHIGRQLRGGTGCAVQPIPEVCPRLLEVRLDGGQRVVHSGAAVDCLVQVVNYVLHERHRLDDHVIDVVRLPCVDAVAQLHEERRPCRVGGHLERRRHLRPHTVVAGADIPCVTGIANDCAACVFGLAAHEVVAAGPAVLDVRRLAVDVRLDIERVAAGTGDELEAGFGDGLPAGDVVKCANKFHRLGAGARLLRGVDTVARVHRER